MVRRLSPPICITMIQIGGEENMKRLMEKEIRILFVTCGSHYISDHEIHNERDAVNLLSEELKEMANEKHMALYLSNKGRPICFHTAGIGTEDMCYVPTQTIAKIALLVNAASVIILHNHPSGSLTTIPADIQVTRKIEQALALLKIKLNDHIIVRSQGDTFSFLGQGIIGQSSFDAEVANT